MTITEILEHAKSLSPAERSELVNQLMAMDAPPRTKPKTGAEIVAMLNKIDPIEFVDPEIEDPVEWVKAQRQKEANRHKPYWNDKN